MRFANKNTYLQMFFYPTNTTLPFICAFVNPLTHLWILKHF